MREIDGVPGDVPTQFSTRRTELLDAYDAMVDEFHDKYARTPTRAERAHMLDNATMLSRQAKAAGDENLHDQWRRSVSDEDLASIGSNSRPNKSLGVASI
jgi:hypothetical protein